MKSLINYVKNAYAELQRVSWHSKKEIIRLTGYVVGVSLGVGILVMIFDYAFANVLNFILSLKK